jgi:phenylpropionate dioxygenase-like ring-hydroxylating dioxygenase large terminal subunit
MSIAPQLKDEQLPSGAEAMREARSASQIGPFDYCPKVGFREYWYPGIQAKRVGREPIHQVMLGDDLVFFRDKDGKIVALSDWCPHRGARLSSGSCEFKGTIACPYHGYVFDGTGQCVAGLVESPDSPFVPKLRAQKYPTAEHEGLVYVWMGKTEPVPLEQDLPMEFLDPTLTHYRYLEVRVWEANWVEPVAQGIDFHAAYLHRNVNFWRFFNRDLTFFRPRMISQGGCKIVADGEDYVNVDYANVRYGQDYYPGFDAKWPRHVWWRILPRKKGPGMTGKPFVNYKYNAQLPSIIRVTRGSSIHMRWMVPLNNDETRVWTFTIIKKPKTWLRQLYEDVWYWGWRRPDEVINTNVYEDLVVFKKGRLNLDRPQKLGPLDAGLIYFRRHLARRSRDFKRLGGAEGCLKAPPGTYPVEEGRTEQQRK